MRLRDPEMLRRAIAARGLTGREVATLAGVHHSFISHLLPPANVPGARPRRPGCSPDTAHRIAAAVRRPVDELFLVRGPDDPSTGPIPAQP